MKNKLALILLLGILFSSLAAQDWKKGTITVSDGTVRMGELKVKNWKTPVTQIHFREREEEDQKSYSLKALEAFTVGEQVYIIQSLTINSSPRNINNLVLPQNKTEAIVRGALMKLISGSLELWEYIDAKGLGHFYYRQGDGPLNYLKFGRYLKQGPDGESAVQEVNEYHFQLSKLLSDCPKLLPQISKTDYQRRTLMRLVESYYSCSGEQLVNLVKVSPSDLSYGLVAGGDYFFDRAFDLNGAGYFFGGFAKYYFTKGQATALRLGFEYHGLNRDQSNSVETPLTNNVTTRTLDLETNYFVGKLGVEFQVARLKHPILGIIGLTVDHATVFTEKRNFISVTNGDRLEFPGLTDYSGTTFTGLHGGFAYTMKKIAFNLEAHYFSKTVTTNRQRGGTRISLSLQYSIK